MPGSEPADAPRARPKRIRPAPKPLKWRRAPWFGLAFIALVAGVLNALGVGKPRPAASATAPVVETASPRAAAGWQEVAGRSGTYAYDVPPGWEPAPDTQQSWPGSGLRLVTSAFLGRNSCGRSPGGGAGVASEPVADPETAARRAVTDLTAAAYGGVPRLGTGMDGQVGGANVPARVVVAEVTPAATSECAAKHALVAAMGFGTGSGVSGVVVAYADSDRSGGSVREDLVRIVRSYRFR
ncbi:hypothetical protein [Amycolatopsis sp. cmx-4-68]|uniref:hypothetical protein n=1 Tax=Amycolatopsis sp. cmx-4-68 TaxID=2790938 RepID=UPI00397BE326